MKTKLMIISSVLLLTTIPAQAASNNHVKTPSLEGWLEYISQKDMNQSANVDKNVQHPSFEGWLEYKFQRDMNKPIRMDKDIPYLSFEKLEYQSNKK